MNKGYFYKFGIMNVRLIYTTLALLIFTSLNGFTQNKFDKKFEDHFGNVQVATFSMNGKLFATGGWDNMINVYSGDSTELVSSLYGHGAAITSISIARSNKALVSGSKDRKVNLWKWSEEDSTFVLDSTVGIHKHPVSSVIYGPGMRTIFSAATDGEIHVHNLKAKKHKVIKHPDEITHIAISNNRQKIYCADHSPNLTIYNPFGVKIATYEGHTDQINSVSVARNNHWVVTGSSDKSIIVWDVHKGKQKMVLKGHDWKVMSTDISFDSKYMVSGSTDGVCILWDLHTGEKLKTFTVNNGQIKSVAISPNKEYIVAAIAFEDLEDFGTTGAVIWKTGFVAPKKKKRKAPTKRTTSKKTASNNKSKTTSSKSKTTGKVIQKDEQVEISIE